MSSFPRLTRFGWKLALVLGGGTVFALDGCDPTVKDTVLGGLQDASTTLADTLIQAFFTKLQTDGQTTSTSTTTTLLQTAHDLIRMLA